MTPRERRRQRKKEENQNYTWDIIDILLWVPELPIRFVLWIGRGVVRAFHMWT
ncbi:hypothetical protein [Terribacillus sp. DMT04]|uniref:hypothetical protein n=1 Tax=Terribacillus sp. DMT04 TaxID=2850441 RepID=UPI001C2C489A|nr:hypothetical protein [Terribacillus sp. DMT04]QXE02838.1 hypothetical protein KS242_06570 [Terribacillus sp. DMT04]